jgi:hypothetical protein
MQRMLFRRVAGSGDVIALEQPCPETVSRSDGSPSRLLPIFRAPGSCRTPLWFGRGSPPGAFPVSANQVSRICESPLNSDCRLGHPSSPPSDVQRSPLTRVVRQFLWGFPHAPYFTVRRSAWLTSQVNYNPVPAGRTSEAKEALEKAMAMAPASFAMYVRGVSWHRQEDHAHMLAGLRNAGWIADAGEHGSNGGMAQSP